MTMPFPLYLGCGIVYYGGMRQVTTSHMRQNMGAVIAAVTAGESLELTRGGFTVGYLISPREWARIDGIPVSDLADQTGLKGGAILHMANQLADDWGRPRVIADAGGGPDNAPVILHRAAALEIARTAQRVMDEGGQQ